MTEPESEGWALVTGAGRGIGRAIALALARHRFSVALTARTGREVDDVARACAEAGAPEVSTHIGDLRDPGFVDRLAAELLAERGMIDVLVNNAGAATSGNAVLGDPDEWTQMMALNLLAPMRLTRRLAPAMVERERGTIINIGSVSAVEGMERSGAYAASKHGLRGWSRSCYQRLRGYGIKVALINPGFVRTEMVSGVPGVRHDRMLSAEDVAAAAMLAVTTSSACCPEEITLRLTRTAYT